MSYSPIGEQISMESIQRPKYRLKKGDEKVGIWGLGERSLLFGFSSLNRKHKMNLDSVPVFTSLVH